MFPADGSFTWQIVWSDRPAINPGRRSAKKRQPAPLQALGFGWMSCGRRVLRQFKPISRGVGPRDLRVEQENKGHESRNVDAGRGYFTRKNVEREVVLGAVEAAWRKLPRNCTPAMWISVLHWIAIAATTRRSAVGMSCPMRRACNCLTRKSLFEAKADSPTSRSMSTSKSRSSRCPIGRIGAMAAKQVILQKIRDAEREMLLNDFMSRGEKIFVGTVKRMDKGDIIVEAVAWKAACVAALK